jgi:hypothetical protein
MSRRRGNAVPLEHPVEDLQQVELNGSQRHWNQYSRQ